MLNLFNYDLLDVCPTYVELQEFPAVAPVFNRDPIGAPTDSYSR